MDFTDGTSKLSLKLKFKIIYSVCGLALSICNDLAMRQVVIGVRIIAKLTEIT